MVQLPPGLVTALELAPGAVFRRAALQVNPWEYVVRHGSTDGFTGADDYHQQLVAALVGEQIEIIGITNHDSTDDGGLRILAEAAGILVFPGMELACRETGIHVCLLFDPSTTAQELADLEGWAGPPRGEGELSPCRRTVTEVMEEVERRGGVTYFPHVHNTKGLLGAVGGDGRITLWCHDLNRAIAVPVPVAELADAGHRTIVQNGDAAHRRNRLPAVLHANDVSHPSDVHDRAWTWLKTSSNDIEGLRQAFLDPDSRVRLSTQEGPEEHARIVAIAWDGGFLHDVAVHLNPGLSVLIGGRGAGKSTIIESLRFVFDLDAHGDTTRRMQTEVLPRVLGPDATVSVLIEVVDPSPRRFLVRRSIGADTIVTGDDGRSVRAPLDLLPHLELFGQHEIVDYTEDPAARLKLLRRFVRVDLRQLQQEIDEAERTLGRTRERTARLNHQLRELDTQLAGLEREREELADYEAAGVEERLMQKSRYDEDQRLLDRARNQITDLRDGIDDLASDLPFDVLFLRDDVVEGRPGEAELLATRRTIASVSAAALGALQRAQEVLDAGLTAVSSTREPFDTRREAAEADYEQARTQMGRKATHYVKLRDRVAKLPQLGDQRDALATDLGAITAERSSALERRRSAFDRVTTGWTRAAAAANDRSRGLVRVTVQRTWDLAGIEQLLRDDVRGRLDTVINALQAIDSPDMDELLRHIDDGAAALAAYLGDTTGKQSARVVEELTVDGHHRLQELQPLLALAVELNVGDVEHPSWEPLDRLSTGQRATAILLLVLSDSTDPLIIDQPEDDLDNAFITEGVVPRLRAAKVQRQILLSTHNANLPVLGDAELILALRPIGRPEAREDARTHVAARGSIDDADVREAVSNLLEGGRDAFENRQRRYGF